MDCDPGLPPTEVRPTPDEHAGDDNSQYEPTSRANSQVARELIRKGQALSSQGPESLRSRSDRGRTGRPGARSPSPVGSRPCKGKPYATVHDTIQSTCCERSPRPFDDGQPGGDELSASQRYSAQCPVQPVRKSGHWSHGRPIGRGKTAKSLLDFKVNRRP